MSYFAANKTFTCCLFSFALQYLDVLFYNNHPKKIASQIASTHYKNSVKMNKTLKLIIFLTGTTLPLACQNNSSLLTAENETLLIAAKGEIVNINLETNTIKWQYKSKNDTIINYSVFTVDDKTIYAPFSSGKITALDLNSGKQVWEGAINNSDMEIQENTQNNPYITTTPLIYENNLYLNTSSLDRSKSTAYCFDKFSGKKKWQTETDIYERQCINLINDYLFLGFSKYTLEGKAESIFKNPKEQEELDPQLWTQRIHIQIQADKNNLYAANKDFGRIFCLTFDNDTYLEKHTLKESPFINNPEIFKWIFYDYEFNSATDLLSSEDMLFAALEDQYYRTCIFAIDKKSGKTVWKRLLGTNNTPKENDPNTSNFFMNKVKTWSLINNQLTVCDQNYIYQIDLDGKLINQVLIQGEKHNPLSNIEMDHNNNFYFITIDGVTKYNAKSENFEIILKKNFYRMPFTRINDFQIKYLPKK